MTAPAAVWTGTPPTSSPPTSPVPPGELTGQWRTPSGPAREPDGGQQPQASAARECRNRPWPRAIKNRRSAPISPRGRSGLGSRLPECLTLFKHGRPLGASCQRVQSCAVLGNRSGH
jgi:hypothetical protein